MIVIIYYVLFHLAYLHIFVLTRLYILTVCSYQVNIHAGTTKISFVPIAHAAYLSASAMSSLVKHRTAGYSSQFILPHH